MSNVRLVTLSATYGAGGSVIGPLLAERLGVPFLDRLSTTVESGPREVSSDAERAESPRSAFLEGLTLLSADWSIPTPRDPADVPGHLKRVIEHGIDDALSVGRAVVLGRAAAPVLGSRPGVLHVRLDGPADRRTRRGAAWEGVELAVADRHRRDTDSLRARTVRELFRCDVADPSLYHLVLDTTVMALDAAVEVIARAAEAAFSFDEALASEVTRLAGRAQPGAGPSGGS